MTARLCIRGGMSDVSQGPDWWFATDGKWYPPERHPNYRAPTSPPPVRDAPPGPGWWKATDGQWYPPERHPSYAPTSSLSVSALPPTSPASAHAFRVPSATSGRRRVLIGGVVVVVLVAVGAAVLVLVDVNATGSTHTIKGTMDVISMGTFSLGKAGTRPCDVPPSYGGEMDGEKVTVINGMGRALRIGTLSNSVVSPDGGGCQFSFTVRGVPNSSMYSVTFGIHMGPVYTLSEMQKSHWTMAVPVTP